MPVLDRFKKVWNAFVNEEEKGPPEVTWNVGATYGPPPSRPRPLFANERTIVNSVYTRIGIDVASIKVRHGQLDDQQRFKEEIPSAHGCR